MTQAVSDPLETGREAARRHAWRDAYDALQSADKGRSLTPDDVVQLAEAAWWTGRLEEALELRERAHAEHLEAGDRTKAARMAVELAFDQMMRMALSVASGWLARGARLLEGEEESVVHGYLALGRATYGLRMGEVDGVPEALERAGALAEQFGDQSLGAQALALTGLGLVYSGDVSAGLPLLEEAAAAAQSGTLDPLTTGAVYCMTISACHDLGDCGRAAEWTDVAHRWCKRLDVTGFPGSCRIHQAEATRLRGDWAEAEEQALRACAELHDYDRWLTAIGHYEVGEIRRRRGDFAAAEAAYRTASELGHEPQPGLALLRLAQGKVDAAARGLDRVLTEEWHDPLARARGLPAQIEILLAKGEIARARAAADELERIADEHRVDGRRTSALEGAIRLGHGQIHLAERDWHAAAAELRAARDTWNKVGAPYETAQARLLLGLAYRGAGDESGATEELVAAKATFERLGAVLDLQRTSELLGETASQRTFMFTDLVDSTKLATALGDEKWRKLLSWHDRTLGELIEDAGGEVIKQTGDGYFAAFRSTATAIEAAVAIQRALDAHEPLAPDVRIGLHAGGGFKREDADYGGQGVHLAARIGALAGAGEVLVSRESIDGGTRLPLSEPRTETLQGFDEPVELVAVHWR